MDRKIKKKSLDSAPYIDSVIIEKQIPQYIDIVKNNLEIFYKNFKSEFNL